MPETLSIIVPCYNEEKTLVSCIERVLELASDSLRLEIIIVDDCSQDASLTVAQSMVERHPDLVVLSHPVNRGKGAALRTGFARATGDYVGIQDADLEYDPLQYRLLLAPILDGKADVVFGSRYLQADKRRVLYFWHTWMNKTLTTISNMFTNLDLTDMETCYKLFRREIIQAVTLREERFGIEPEITAKISQIPCRVYECAISYTPRTYEEGKKISWKDGVWALFCIFRYSAHSAPLPMQFVIYLFIGLVCAAVNLAIFAVLYGGGLFLGTTVVIGFVVAAALNYALCVTVLFRHNARWNSAAEIAAYLLAVALMGVVDYGTTVTLAAVGVAAMVAKILATGVGFVGNFALRRFLVFPERRVTPV